MMIKLLNSWARFRIKHVQPSQVLLLASHCLQCSACSQPVVDKAAACKKCGKCRIGELVGLSEEFNVTLRIVGGGRQAIKEARKDEYKAIVAVACSNELFAGSVSMFPKPVMTVTIDCPNGPCKDTQVDIDKVRMRLSNILNTRQPQQSHDSYNNS